MSRKYTIHLYVFLLWALAVFNVVSTDPAGLGGGSCHGLLVTVVEGCLLVEGTYLLQVTHPPKTNMTMKKKNKA